MGNGSQRNTWGTARQPIWVARRTRGGLSRGKEWGRMLVLSPRLPNSFGWYQGGEECRCGSTSKSITMRNLVVHGRRAGQRRGGPKQRLHSLGQTILRGMRSWAEGCLRAGGSASAGRGRSFQGEEWLAAATVLTGMIGRCGTKA
ncbi:hypothetical protein PPACK8108_LOCUS11204, partial [Phakopsora pachyrhizi]